MPGSAGVTLGRRGLSDAFGGGGGAGLGVRGAEVSRGTREFALTRLAWRLPPATLSLRANANEC